MDPANDAAMDAAGRLAEVCRRMNTDLAAVPLDWGVHLGGDAGSWLYRSRSDADLAGFDAFDPAADECLLVGTGFVSLMGEVTDPSLRLRVVEDVQELTMNELWRGVGGVGLGGPALILSRVSAPPWSGSSSASGPRSR